MRRSTPAAPRSRGAARSRIRRQCARRFTGRIGAAKVFEGALITAGHTLLATIHGRPRLGLFQRQRGRGARLPAAHGATEPTPEAAVEEVQLTLSDGTIYPEPGVINFVRARSMRRPVHSLRAEFPNPQHTLVPGLFARIRVTAERRQNAIAVPDRAVQQQLDRYFVTAVGADDKAEARHRARPARRHPLGDQRGPRPATGSWRASRRPARARRSRGHGHSSHWHQFATPAPSES